MNIRLFLLSIIISFCVTSCKSPETQRPVEVRSGSFIKESVERNKKLYEDEKAVIKKIIDTDKEHSYFASDSGFWYYYNTRQGSDGTEKPEIGDTVTTTRPCNQTTPLPYLTYILPYGGGPFVIPRTT